MEMDSIKEIEIRQTIKFALTEFSRNTLPYYISDNDLVKWILSFTYISDVESLVTFDKKVSEDSLIARLIKDTLSDTILFYYTSLVHIGRVIKVSELALENIDAALTRENLAKTLELNIGLLENNRLKDGLNFEMVEKSFTYLLDKAKVNHTNSREKALSWWEEWNKEVDELFKVVVKISAEYWEYKNRYSDEIWQKYYGFKIVNPLVGVTYKGKRLSRMLDEDGIKFLSDSNSSNVLDLLESIKISKSESTLISSALTENFQKLKEGKREFLEAINSSSLDLNTLHDFSEMINMHIDRVSSSCKLLGEIDGRVGYKNIFFYDTALSHATYLTDQVNATLAGKVHGIKIKLKDSQKKLNEKEKLLKRLHDLDENDKYNASRHKSGMLFLSYMVAFVCIFIYEIVFSLSLLDYFKIEGLNGFWGKSYFIICVITYTLFSKILYENYSRVMNNILLRKARVLYWPKWLSAGSVKVLTLFGIISMVYYIFDIVFFSPLLRHEAINPEAQTSGLESIYGIPLFYKILSIILPIIGGICLSLSLYYFSYRSPYRNTKRRKNLIGKEISAIKKEYEMLINQYNHLLNLRVDWKKTNEKEKLISSIYTSKYNQGFKIGARQNLGSDL